MTSKATESVIKKPPDKEKPGDDSLTDEFNQTFQKN